MDFAERAAPGRRAVAVHDVRLHQWITATPAVDIPVRIVRPTGPDRVAVSLGAYARAVVELGAGLRPVHARRPVDASPPPHERRPEHDGGRALHRAAGCSTARGSRASRELTAIGDRPRTRRARPPRPRPARCWTTSASCSATGSCPASGPHHRVPGRHEGDPLPRTASRAPASGWSAWSGSPRSPTPRSKPTCSWSVGRPGLGGVHRLAGPPLRQQPADPRGGPVPEPEHPVPELRPGGWTLVHEQWPDLATRELIMRNHPGAARSASSTTAHAPRGRRQWLLGRIAVKDAVRRWLWDGGAGHVFPAEMRVGNDPAGRPYRHRWLRPDPARTARLARAPRARPASRSCRTDGPCGIDIEEITDRPEGTLAVALTATASSRCWLAARGVQRGAARAALVHPVLGRQGSRREGARHRTRRRAEAVRDHRGGRPTRLTVRVAGAEYLRPALCADRPKPSGLTRQGVRRGLDGRQTIRRSQDDH